MQHLFGQQCKHKQHVASTIVLNSAVNVCTALPTASRIILKHNRIRNRKHPMDCLQQLEFSFAFTSKTTCKAFFRVPSFPEIFSPDENAHFPPPPDWKGLRFRGFQDPMETLISESTKPFTRATTPFPCNLFENEWRTTCVWLMGLITTQPTAKFTLLLVHRLHILARYTTHRQMHHRLSKHRCDSGREKPASTAHEKVISGISILHYKFLLLSTKRAKEDF